MHFTDLSLAALLSATSMMASVNAQASNPTGPFTLPPLGYDYSALEPYFDTRTMQIHHDKHHQTYVTNLNNLVASLPTNLSSLPVDELVTHLDDIPAQNRTGVRNNAGGHANHSFFWKSLQLNTTLEGDLLAAIERDFGSVDAFKAGFAANATKVFGSGWAWLIAQDGGKLKVVSTANQDSPLMDEKYAGNGTHGYPIIGLDVWEHAYYLKYQNLRVDYIQSYWNVTNWEFASQRYAEALAMG